MKSYVYKIQWLFPVNGNFVTSTPQLRKELYSVIKAVGAKSLTFIMLRDNELNIITTYSDMVKYPYNTASNELIKYIKKQLKKNDKIYHIELVRK